ncbi:glycosyltransferase family 2 protein [Halalkalibacter sp. APA_J-10(15)]|uniref:glycosyltransferase family 2 protein n=1 Tax=Halalkalibacter sp. APA_J-10(15) TaxID=2933805 RepID=UPI001FF2DFE6|nr:glycosyltransferase family 2 protein [Halalkalibacter sp. APA_J-10(15)]MCK0470088.1 glycosyltransferase [Halalkalibacter sp. APA_J-10(15)]
MGDTPFFSVVIPTYNRESLLKEAIKSVLNQTFQNFEVLVVDDGSTDKTLEIIDDFHDDRIKKLRNNRVKGGGGARNTGIYKATGKWVAFLDDDDVWLEEKLELQYKQIMCLSEKYVIVYTGYEKYDFDNNKVERKILPQKKGDIYYDLLYKNYIGTFSTVAIKREPLLSIGGLDESLEARQDLDLYVRLADKYSVDYINKSLVRYRYSNTDRITLNTKKRLQGNKKFHEKYIEPDNNISFKLKLCSNGRIFAFAVLEKQWRLAIRQLLPAMLLLFVDFRYFLSINKIILTTNKKVKR